MLELLIIIAIVIPAVITTVVAKVDEAHAKHDIREETGVKDYPLLGSMSIMPFTTFLITLPFFYFVDFEVENIVWILAAGVLLRFIPWVIMVSMLGKYHDAMHQSSSNFTLYENFAGPIGALITFAIYNFSQNTEVSILWYLATPAMGIFMVWAMREGNDKKLSGELLEILSSFVILVSIESAILLFCINYIPDNNAVDFINDIGYIDTGMFYFLAIVSISSLLASTYFSKQLIRDVKNGYSKIIIKVGLIRGLSDFFYFAGFTVFGPIFLIARRGLIIPIQNLYLALKEGHHALDVIKSPLKNPILSLRGGKDFIISFVDLVFNNVIKFIIKLLS
jgi:hypothetical protein